MKYLEPDLEKIKKCLIEEFNDPFEEKVITNFLSGNAKFIRSKLALLYIKAQGVILQDNIYEILAIGEIIHNSSLLHDDVLDDAITRRGETTISKAFNNKISILAGDYLLSYAIEKLLKIDNKEIFNIFKNTTKSMCEAEIKQFLHRGNLCSEKEYLQICKGKTAELFSAILKSCAIISNLDIEKSNLFGELFGLCFQIKNDLEPKSSLQDIKNKIYTAKDIIGIEKTNYLLDNYKEEMRDMLSIFPENIYKKDLEDLIKNL